MSVEFDEEAARSLERSYQTADIAEQRRRTLAAIDLQAGESALDVGCGPGFLVREMAEQLGEKGRAVGIDSSEQMLALAGRRTADLPQVALIEGRIEDSGIKDDSFDAVCCSQVLLFLADTGAALAEFHRILKPGGRLAVIETDWRGVVLNADDDALTRRMFAAWDAAQVTPNLPVCLKRTIEEAGFSNVEIEGIPIINTSFGPEGFSGGMLRGVAKKAKATGFVSDEEAKSWIDDLKARNAVGDYFFCVNRFLFKAVK